MSKHLTSKRQTRLRTRQSDSAISDVKSSGRYSLRKKSDQVATIPKEAEVDAPSTSISTRLRTRAAVKAFPESDAEYLLQNNVDNLLQNNADKFLQKTADKQRQKRADNQMQKNTDNLLQTIAEKINEKVPSNAVTIKRELLESLNCGDREIETTKNKTLEINPNRTRSTMDIQKDSILRSLVENIHLDIKQEIADTISKQNEITVEDSELVENNIKQENYEIQNDNIEENVNRTQNMLNIDIKIEEETIVGDTIEIQISTNEKLANVKDETDLEGNSLVSYDFPQFDTTSMDSSEGSVLGHVEVCLREAIIPDGDDSYEQSNLQYGSYMNQATENIPEMHLISNKLLNKTTVAHQQDGLIDSNNRRALIMEILPINTCSTTEKIGEGPEEILPTPTDSSSKEDYAFQLNSITGDDLPLEAYNLLSKSKQKNISQTVYNCNRCPKQYRNMRSLKHHKKVHDSIDKYENGRIRGIQKRKDIKNKKQIAREDGMDQLYKCTCGKSFCRRSRMETCLRSHDEDTSTVFWFSCVTCSKEFKSKEELLDHRKRLHSTRKKFLCKFCPTDYKTRKELFKHLRVHQKVQLMEFKVISEVVEGKQKLKCFLCNKSFDELSELKSHVLGDHTEPYKCPHCKESFSTVYECATHAKNLHPKVKGHAVLDVLEAFFKLAQSWKCEECNLQFYQADKLAIHKVESHTPVVKKPDVEQFQCTDCLRVFASNKSLNSHKRVHHSTEATAETSGIAEQGHLCVHCRKICKDENALTSHMRFHSSERKYPCKYCDFRFATPEKRKVHSEIHTGNMRYVCFICEYRCSSENRLKNHKNSAKHISMKEYLQSGKPLDNLAPKTEVSNEDPEEKDQVKKRRLSEKSSPENEVAKESEATCDVCGEKFPDEKEMLEHKQTHPFIEFPNEDKPTRIFFK